MGARPGGHLGVSGRTCALGVTLWVALALSPGTLARPTPASTSGLAGLLQRPCPPGPALASAGSLAPADDPEDDPAIEAISARLPFTLPPVALLPRPGTAESLAVPAAAPGPRGPPASRL